MSPTDNEDSSFLALPTRLRRRIDSAFDSIASSGAQSQQSKNDVFAEAGGFVVEVEESAGPSQLAEYEAGGFIVEDLPSSSFGAPPYITLTEIPRALGFLDLSPDDEIMEVFKNAATGWGARPRIDGVSRKDWRAVCAALLEGERVDGSDEENPVADEDYEMGTHSGPDSDEYQMGELSGDAEERSSDEYEEPHRTAPKARKSQKVPRGKLTKSSGTEVSRQLTESQKAQCRQDFGRFFPHIADGELDRQRIMIKDITRVADSLKENLKTEEILEMLDAFSTSPDQSMSLADFEHMMILAEMV